MSEFVEIKTAELTDQALAYAVAGSQGLEPFWYFNHDGSFRNIWTEDCGSYRPDTDWEVGGPLLEKYSIGFTGWDSENWLAFFGPEYVSYKGIGPTHLVAACRAIVASVLGETVSVPKELIS